MYTIIVVLFKKIFLDFYFIFVSMYYILLISFGAANHIAFSHKIFFLYVYNIIVLFKNLY